MPNIKRQKRVKAIITLITFVVLIVVVFVIRDQIAETVVRLRTANLWPIALVIPLAFLNHVAIGKLYQYIFRILGERFRLKPMIRLSYEINFVNNVFPSAGLSGFSYLGIRMKGEHVLAGKSAMVQVMRFALVFASFQVLLGLGLLTLAIVGNANNFVVMVTASITTFLFIGTLLVLFVISSKKRLNGFFTSSTRVLNRAIQILRPKHPETINIGRVERIFTDLHENYKHVRKNISELKKPFIAALASNFTEIVSIYVVFLGFGVVVNPGAIIIAYAVANFAGIISILPGGVGVYEGIMTAVLVATGVPVAVSIPVIVSYRILSMASQIPVGYYFYQRNLQSY